MIECVDITQVFILCMEGIYVGRVRVGVEARMDSHGGIER